MPETAAAELFKEFLSSARVFAWSVREVLERGVLQEIGAKKLTFSQLKLLYLVAHTNGHTTIGDAAAFLGVSNAAAGKTVDKLVRRRYLRRAEMQDNRRSSQLSLTETSRKLLAAYEAKRDALAAKVFAEFSPEDLRRTAELLDRLAGAFVQQQTDPDHICLQCEIYYREKCRFCELGRRNCFYQRRKAEKPEAAEEIKADGLGQ